MNDFVTHCDTCRCDITGKKRYMIGGLEFCAQCAIDELERYRVINIDNTQNEYCNVLLVLQGD